MNQLPYDVYLFDFDGTTFDSRLSLIPVYRAAFAVVGMNDITEEQCESFMHYSLEETLTFMKVPKDQWMPFYMRIMEAIDEPKNLDLIKIFPETERVLQSLSSKGAKLAIVSGNGSKHIQLVLEHFGLENVFSVVVGSDVYKKHKPDAEPIFMGLRLLGCESVDRKRVVYVGDSLQDEECARNAGADSLLVDRLGVYKNKNLRCIASLDDLLR